MYKLPSILHSLSTESAMSWTPNGDDNSGVAMMTRSAGGEDRDSLVLRHFIGICTSSYHPIQDLIGL
jgi:hypothetical protein